jgi:hypothetical protein
MASQVFAHLQRTNPESVTDHDLLRNVLRVLAAPSSNTSLRGDHLDFAKAVISTLEQSWSSDSLNSDRDRDLFESYIILLSRTSSSSRALQQLIAAKVKSWPLWLSVLNGFVLEDSMPDLFAALRVMQSSRELGSMTADQHEQIVHLFATRDSPQTFDLLNYGTTHAITPTTACLTEVLAYAMRTKNSTLTKQIASQLESRTDLGTNIGVLLEYYTFQGQNLEAKLEALAKQHSLDLQHSSTFNPVIRSAYLKHDIALAQRYIDLGRSFGWRPDAVTWLARLDSQIAQGDLDGAAETFNALSHEDIPGDRSDIPVLNRYITLLCTNPSKQPAQLTRVVDILVETNGDFTASALASLTQYFLSREDLVAIASLLRYRIGMLPLSDRDLIIEAFNKYILSTLTKDQPAFNAYDALRRMIPEFPISKRIPIMHSFFKRERPDLACLVFGHMRQSQDTSIRPTANAYAECFAGIAKARDIDGLQMVYNMLKMDHLVDPTTHIHNTLILAYTACRAPYTAIIDHFWKILDSNEGPSVNSFILALQSCETWVPQGSQEARRIIALMQEWNMVITKPIYDAYLGAIAGQSEFENCVELIETMHGDIGEEPDYVTLGTFYNAIPYQWRKDEVQAWAEKRYPELWRDLETCGDEVDEDWGIRYFNVERSVGWGDELLFERAGYAPGLAERAVLMLGGGSLKG